MEQLINFWPFLLPVALIQVGLAIAAVVHILRHNTFKVGNKVIWLIVSIFVNIIGPILYFIIGKADD